MTKIRLSSPFLSVFPCFLVRKQSKPRITRTASIKIFDLNLNFFFFCIFTLQCIKFNSRTCSSSKGSVFQPFSSRGTFKTLMSICRKLDRLNSANLSISGNPVNNQRNLWLNRNLWFNRNLG